ncbi:hypothetical protein VF21_03146 [Pseudogymnoascus sp. 05NY08]|nr:hypothetical protein VF21_03146 [Pseudogymnoascus sp. 05NY08]
MSSSNRRSSTVEYDWESCTSEMTNTPITPPPKYSSFQMVNNIGTESINTLQQENLQSESQIDLENGQLQSAKPGSSWHGKICIPVKRLYNRIPVKKICGHITLTNVGKCIGIAILVFLGLSGVVVGVVLVWDLVVYVVVNRARVCSKTD